MTDRIRGAAAGLALVLVVADCAATISPAPSPVASPSPAPGLSPSPPGAAASPALSTLPPSHRPSPPASPASLAAFTTPVPPGAETPWAGINWRKLAPDDPLAQVRSVLRWSGGFVALGAVIATGETSRTPVWVSADGVTWRPLDADVFGPATIVIGVGETAGGIVALTLQGGANHCDPQDATATGLVCWTLAIPLQTWTSRDGASWTAHPGPDIGWVPICDGCGLDVPIFGIGTPGLLVFNRGIPDAPSPSVRAAFSPDGITWETLPADAFPAGFHLGYGDASGFRPGFIAVGATVSDLGAHTQAVALSSPDGRHWVSRDLPTSGLDPREGTDTVGIVIGTDGLIVTGTAQAGGLLWWSSVSGGTWRRLVGFPPLGAWTSSDGPVPDGTLLGDGERMLAYRGGGKPAAWMSLDGRSWRTITVSASGPSNAGDWVPMLILTPIGVLGTGDDGSTWFGAPLT